MLKSGLTHPALLAALARAGHGSRVLLADGNYPTSTAAHPRATLIELSLRSGLPTVPDVLELILPILPIEGAAVMTPGDGDAPAHADYARRLAPIQLQRLDRHAFYAAARNDDLAVVVATGDARHFSNLLLTVGVA